jgi:O-antigen/teichoic acid export membrane protein
MSRESLSQRLMKNVIWNFIGQVWMVLLGFFATPFIVRTLNVNFYGIYTLVGVIIGYFSFLQFGLGTAAIKYIAQYFVNRQEENIHRTFWACFVVYALLGAVGSAAIAVLSRWVAIRVFKIPAGLEETAVVVISIGGLGFLNAMLMAVVSGVIQAVGRFDILNRVGIVLGTLQIGLAIILLKLGFSLREVIISNVAVQTLGVYIVWRIANRILPYLKQPVWDLRVFVTLLKFGGFVSISSIVGPILLNIEKLFLTSLRSVASLTYYSVPFGLVDRLTVIRSSFSSVLFPAFSSLQESADIKVNRDLHERTTLYLFFLYTFFVLFFIIFGREFLASWIGGNFSYNSTRILAILSLAGLLNALAVPSLNVLQGLNKPQIPALFHVIETVLYIPAAYFLIARYGGTGAALAFLLRVCLDTVLLNYASCRLFGVKLVFWYGRIFLRGFIPVLVAGAGLWGMQNLHLQFFAVINLLGICAVFLVYCGVVWQWGIDGFARMRIKQLVYGIIHR